MSTKATKPKTARKNFKTLKVGCTYRTRGGVVVVAQANPEHPDWPFLLVSNKGIRIGAVSRFGYFYNSSTPDRRDAVLLIAKVAKTTKPKKPTANPCPYFTCDHHQPL